MTGGKPIAHFERKYDIHPDGRVWNKGKECWQALRQNDNGYWIVQLNMNGRVEQLLIHRVVALHYLPNPYGHPQVNHIDGDKSHNWLENLEWISREGNIQHSLEIGLRAGFMSIPEKEALLLRALAGEKISDIAEPIRRHPVVLSKMLRTLAERTGRANLWEITMKQRRKNAALRNLEKINARDSSGSEDPVHQEGR